MSTSVDFSIDDMIAGQIGTLHGLVLDALIPWSKADEAGRRKLAVEGVSSLESNGAISAGEGDVLRAHFDYFHTNSAATNADAIEGIRALGATSGESNRSPMMKALLGVANDSIARYGPGEAAADLAGGIFGGVVGGLLGAGIGAGALSYAASTIDPNP